MSTAVTVSRHIAWRSAISAGLLAGTVSELFLLAVGAASWPATYQWIASGLVGHAAFAALSFALLGVAMHFAISITFGVVLAALRSSWAPARGNVLAVGTLYGLAVFAIMQLVTVAAHIWAPPSPLTLLLYILDHIVFFGVPLAWWLARPERPGR